MRPQRAKSAVLSMLAGVIAVHLAVAVAQETVCPQWRDANFGVRWRLLQARRAAHPERPLILVVGSSRTELGVRPDVLEEFPVHLAGQRAEVFNFGQPATDAVKANVVLQRVLRAGVQPARVVIEVLPPGLYFDGCFEQYENIPTLTWADLEVTRRFSASPSGVRRKWLASRMASLSVARRYWLSQIAPGWLPINERLTYLWQMADQYGWMTLPDRMIDPAYHPGQLRVAHLQYAEHLRTFHISKLPDMALRRMLSACRERSIPASLLLSPEGPTFRSWYPPGIREEIGTYLQGLTAEFGGRVIDARDWLPDERYFMDSHHLLPVGAAEFTRRLAAELAE